MTEIIPTMPLLRLTGLSLFIVTVFLAMAALATKTTHIRIKQPDRVTQRLANQSDNAPINTSGQIIGNEPNSGDSGSDSTATGITFRSVPVVYPLAFFAILGLVLWFVPAPREIPKKRKRGRSRRKKRR